MGTIIIIVTIITVIGAIIGYANHQSDPEEGATMGATVGAMSGCAVAIIGLLNLMLIAVPVLIGLWLIKAIFG